MSAPLADQPVATISRKLPPTERDFEIYENVHVCGLSTYSQADLHDLSQTRVRPLGLSLARQGRPRISRMTRIREDREEDRDRL